MVPIDLDFEWQTISHIPAIDVSILLCTDIVSYDCLLIRCDVGQVVTIDVLPDDILLTIVQFYVAEYQYGYLIEAIPLKDLGREGESWQTLVHVCRRWRDLVFGSPRHLNLQLFCTTRTPARETLDVWPALPLRIKGQVSETSVDNVIAELKYNDRICQIELDFDFDTSSQFEKLWTAMQVPFPDLVGLYLSFRGLSFLPVFPDSFFGGSAPRLRHLALNHIALTELPKLLLSATHLVNIHLLYIPHSGYISPDAMVACLSMLTSLETLEFRFYSPQSRPDLENQRSHPPARSILPALTRFRFKGAHEYLEGLVARIDTPLLCQFSATFFNDIDFDTSELIRLVSRSSTLKAPNEVYVYFGSRTTSIRLQPQASKFEYFEVCVSSRVLYWQISFLVQICSTSLPLLFTTKELFICERYDSNFDRKEVIKNIEWLELLLPFTAVKNLYLSKQLARRIAPALQEMTEDGTPEVLFTLQNLYLEGFQPSESIEDGIERFISARHLTNRPVATLVWEGISIQEVRFNFNTIS